MDRTQRTNPLTIISFTEEFSEFFEPIIFSHDPLFLTDDFDIRVDDHNDTAACHFFLFIGVDINNVTCVGINTRTKQCTGSDNYAELRKLYQRLTYA